MQGTIRLFAFWLAIFFLWPLYGGDEAGHPSPPPRATLPALLAGLDSDDYFARRSAAEQLSRLVQSDDNRSAIEQSLQASAPIGFAVREQLGALGLTWNAAGSTSGTDDVKTSADVESWVKQLANDKYQARAAAIDVLQKASATQSGIHWFYPALKKAAAEAENPQARASLVRLLDVARYTWLTRSAYERAAPLSADQIAAHFGALVSPAIAPREATSTALRQKTKATRDAAERELVDALATPGAANDVRRGVVAELAREDCDDDARARLRRLDEWSRPGLAAEYWQRRRNLAIQYFVVGKPSQAPGALRPTQFDRVDDEVAVCTGGNGLQPGEYPVSVAFPHPREQAAFFQLVPFPTARERLIHQYESQERDDGDRLRAITQRTLGPAVAARRPLDDAQLWLLGQLDQPTVAGLLRRYFAEVQDEPFDLSQLAPMLTDVSSVHRAACLMLALDGSPQVVPMLVEAARDKRFLSLPTDEPQAMPWIAALAIAAREPWDGVDIWLAGLIDCEERISFGSGPQADVGGTAAGLLLSRHGHQPGDFDLIAREPQRRGLHDRFEAPINAEYRRRMFEDRLFKQLGLAPHYFASTDGREAVAAWWAEQRGAPFTPAPPLIAPSPTHTAHAPRP